MQEENWRTRRKTCGSKYGLQPNACTAPGPGIEPGLSGAQSAEEEPLRHLLLGSTAIGWQKTLRINFD